MVSFFSLASSPPVALDLHHEVQEVVFAVAVVHQDNEVGHVDAGLGLKAIRHLEPEPVVLDVGAHARMRLGHAAELGLPVAVAHHPVDVAACSGGPPTGLLGGIEADVRSGSRRHPAAG